MVTGGNSFVAQIESQIVYLKAKMVSWTDAGGCWVLREILFTMLLKESMILYMIPLQ